jgi:ubiquinone biosynthesis protein Coq4
MLNTALFARDDVNRRMDAISRGWRAGKAARPLFGIDWSSSWERPLEAIRVELGVHAESEFRKNLNQIDRAAG